VISFFDQEEQKQKTGCGIYSDEMSTCGWMWSGLNFGAHGIRTA